MTLLCPYCGTSLPAAAHQRCPGCGNSIEFGQLTSAAAAPQPEFDPYYTWLGIKPQDQPPHLYRLLGVDIFEPSSDVIEHAVDRQMAHVRTQGLGRHAREAQQLLNELSTARVWLLTPEKRQLYDAELQRHLATATFKTAPTQQVEPAASYASASDNKPMRRGSARASRSLGRPVFYVISIVGGGATGIALALYVVSLIKSQRDTTPAAPVVQVASAPAVPAALPEKMPAPAKLPVPEKIQFAKGVNRPPQHIEQVPVDLEVQRVPPGQNTSGVSPFQSGDGRFQPERVPSTAHPSRRVSPKSSSGSSLKEEEMRQRTLGQLTEEIINPSQEFFRRASVMELKSRGPEAASAIDVLAGKAADPKVGRNCIEALKEIGPQSRSAVPALMKVIETEPYQLARDSALRAVLEIDPQSAEFQPTLTNLLAFRGTNKNGLSRDQVSRNRRFACEVMEKLGAQYEWISPTLLKLLNELDFELQNSNAQNEFTAALEALRHMQKRDPKIMQALLKYGQGKGLRGLTPEERNRIASKAKQTHAGLSNQPEATVTRSASSTSEYVLSPE